MLEKSPFSFFFSLVWTHFRKRTLVMALLSVLGMGLLSLEPLLLRDLVRALEAPTRNPTHAYWLFTLIVVIWFASLACNRLRDYVELRTSPDLRLTAQMRLFEWLDQHNSDFFRAHHSANLAQKVKQSGTAVLALIDIIFDHQVRLLTALAMAIWTLWSVPLYFLFALMTWLCVFIPLSWWFTRKILPISESFGEAASHSSGVLADIAGNMDAVRSFGQHDNERLRFRESLEEEKRASLRVRWFLIIMNSGLYGGQLLFQAAFMGLVVYAHIQGQLGIAEFVMVSSLSVILLTSVWGLTQHLQGFYDQSGILKATLNTVAQPHTVFYKPDAPALACKKGNIELKGVHFSYGNHSVFRNLNLTIDPQEKVGIVGPSGVGKSTLFKLIQRQFDPKSGQILIDGQDLKLVCAQSIARAITEVPQEPALFHRSLKENILYGNPNASQSQIESAIARARCEDFIAERPEGIHAVVGERGLRLSGGERQRIALARAFLKDSPIVLLDEATSSIDSENEALIQAALIEICADRTVLAIAHRLSTVQAMDRIVVLDQGQIIDSGTHFTLLERCDLYANLWGRQGIPPINEQAL